MKTAIHRAALLLLVALFGLTGSTRESIAGAMWISSSPTEINTSIPGRTFELVHFYVVAEGIPSGMQAYEFGFDASPAMALVNTETPANCDVCDIVGGNVVVGLARCVAVDTTFQMLHATAMFITTLSLTEEVCLRASVPSAFEPPGPGYDLCGGGLQQFEIVSQCVGFSGVPVQNLTFGALRARY